MTDRSISSPKTEPSVRVRRAAETIQKDAPEGKAEFIKLELASFKYAQVVLHATARAAMCLLSACLLCCRRYTAWGRAAGAGLSPRRRAPSLE